MGKSILKRMIFLEAFWRLLPGLGALADGLGSELKTCILAEDAKQMGNNGYTQNAGEREMI